MSRAILCPAEASSWAWSTHSKKTAAGYKLPSFAGTSSIPWAIVMIVLRIAVEKGTPVQIGDVPAAVTGDKSRNKPLMNVSW